ncbi:MAG: sodium-dependent transporter, partial [Eubacterium sp.]|nr:sodium-dependent transporter [Eubacterium sp.]
MAIEKRSKFTGKIGFVLAAAGSAVGLGNLWRFPYLAAKDGGGVFLLVYLVLAVTFGFALLATEIALGRKTGASPLMAYGKIHAKWRGLGLLACLVPVLILPYYCTIGGWVFKYCTVFFTGATGTAAQDGYFGDFITGQYAPLIFGGIFLIATAVVVLGGVNKGIEKFSKIIMPALFVLIIVISIYSLTLSYEDSGVTRTGLQGLKKYIVPDFSGMTLKDYFVVLM